MDVFTACLGQASPILFLHLIFRQRIQTEHSKITYNAGINRSSQ